MGRVSLRLGERIDEHDQPSGRGPNANRVVLQPGSVKRLGSGGLELLDRAVDGLGRELFDTDLENQIP